MTNRGRIFDNFVLEFNMLKNRIVYLLLVFCFQFIAFNSFAETTAYKRSIGFNKDTHTDLGANLQNIIQAEETEEDGLEDSNELIYTFYIFDQGYINFDLFLVPKTYICTKSSFKVLYKPLFILNNIFRL
jgi:hypothetical protein